MNIFSLAFDAIAVVLGSLIAAAALTWLGWTAFKIVRHPEWGPPAALILLVTAFGGALRSSEFLRMVVLFSVIAGALVWSEGGEWRLRHARREEDSKPKLPLSANKQNFESKRRAKISAREHLKG